MTARESVAYSLGRDAAHWEEPSYPYDAMSQRTRAMVLRMRIILGPVRVGARVRKDTAQEGRHGRR